MTIYHYFFIFQLSPKFSQFFFSAQMKMAADDFIRLANEWCADENVSVEQMKQNLLKSTEAMLLKDISDNQAIGLNGANEILSRKDSTIRILTHCNTGSLATAGYGTALGVVRKLHELNRLEKVYCTETRPYNQGARLTAFELVHDELPATLICDSMVAALLRLKVSWSPQCSLGNFNFGFVFNSRYILFYSHRTLLLL